MPFGCVKSTVFKLTPCVSCYHLLLILDLDRVPTGTVDYLVRKCLEVSRCVHVCVCNGDDD